MCAINQILDKYRPSAQPTSQTIQRTQREAENVNKMEMASNLGVNITTKGTPGFWLWTPCITTHCNITFKCGHDQLWGHHVNYR